MNLAQMEAAKKNMVIWLSDPHELGRAPRKIEYAGNFELHDMRYYFFKFKTGLLGPWLIGVSGGYESDTTLEPCGHTFGLLAERKGFEPLIRFPVYTISNRAP